MMRFIGAVAVLVVAFGALNLQAATPEQTGTYIGKIKEVKDTSFIIQSAEKSFLEVGKSAVVGKKAEESK